MTDYGPEVTRAVYGGLGTIFLFAVLQLSIERLLEILFGKERPVFVRAASSFAAFLVTSWLMWPHLSGNPLVFSYLAAHVIGPPLVLHMGKQKKSKMEFDLSIWLMIAFFPWMVFAFFLAMAERLVMGIAGFLGFKSKAPVLLSEAARQAKYASMNVKIDGDAVHGGFNTYHLYFEEEKGTLKLSIVDMDEKKFKVVAPKIRGAWRGKVEYDEVDGFVTIFANRTNMAEAIGCIKNALS